MHLLNRCNKKKAFSRLVQMELQVVNLRHVTVEPFKKINTGKLTIGYHEIIIMSCVTQLKPYYRDRGDNMYLRIYTLFYVLTFRIMW